MFGLCFLWYNKAQQLSCLHGQEQAAQNKRDVVEDLVRPIAVLVNCLKERRLEFEEKRQDRKDCNSSHSEKDSDFPCSKYAIPNATTENEDRAEYATETRSR